MEIIIALLFLLTPFTITITVYVVSDWMKRHCVLKCGDEYYVYVYEREHYRLYCNTKYVYYCKLQKIDDGIYTGDKECARRYELNKIDDYYYWCKIIWR